MLLNSFRKKNSMKILPIITHLTSKWLYLKEFPNGKNVFAYSKKVLNSFVLEKAYFLLHPCENEKKVRKSIEDFFEMKFDFIFSIDGGLNKETAKEMLGYDVVLSMGCYFNFCQKKTIDSLFNHTKMKNIIIPTKASVYNIELDKSYVLLDDIIKKDINHEENLDVFERSNYYLDGEFLFNFIPDFERNIFYETNLRSLKSRLAK